MRLVAKRRTTQGTAIGGVLQAQEQAGRAARGCKHERVRRTVRRRVQVRARRGAPARVQRFALAFAQTGLLLGAPAEMECEMERARDTAARCRGPARSPESDAALRAR